MKLSRLLGVVAAFGLFGAGCALDWSVPSGTGGGGQTSDAIAVSCPASGLCECPVGESCAMTCAAGVCNIVCGEGATCDVSCVNATCKLDCKPGATCLAACSSAACEDLCDVAATCSCAGECSSP